MNIRNLLRKWNYLITTIIRTSWIDRSMCIETVLFCWKCHWNIFMSVFTIFTGKSCRMWTSSAKRRSTGSKKEKLYSSIFCYRKWAFLITGSTIRKKTIRRSRRTNISTSSTKYTSSRKKSRRKTTILTMCCLKEEKTTRRSSRISRKASSIYLNWSSWESISCFMMITIIISSSSNKCFLLSLTAVSCFWDSWKLLNMWKITGRILFSNMGTSLSRSSRTFISTNWKKLRRSSC